MKPSEPGGTPDRLPLPGRRPVTNHLLVTPSVHKFGGAALADAVAIRRAADLARSGEGDIVVVSAVEGATDLLEGLARAAAAGRADARPFARRHEALFAQLGLETELLRPFLLELEGRLADLASRGVLDAATLDGVLSLGERVSSWVVARTLAATGTPAVPVDARDAGLTTDDRHGDAIPIPGANGGELARTLRAAQGIPVVTGFIGRSSAGRTTTLGRGGSDLSAALVAEAVGARELILWKTVGGVLTADPSLVDGARVVPALSYDEAAACAELGARVLHPGALDPARRAGLPLAVRDVAAPGDAGTTIRPEVEPRGAVLVASGASGGVVTTDLGERRYCLIGVVGEGLGARASIGRGLSAALELAGVHRADVEADHPCRWLARVREEELATAVRELHERCVG